MTATQNSRELFRSAFDGGNSGRPPLWMMRQAGRYLPEYRSLKDKFGFLGIVKNPEIAVEAALQPMRRFGFDCAIIFSDILVVPEALGFPYKFKDAGGIFLERRVESMGDVERLRGNIGALRERLSYVSENARLLRRELPEKAVLGFCGSPFTLAAYMVEGEGSKGFPRFAEFVKRAPLAFGAMLDALSEALSDYLNMQLECGLDGVQIFDSHAALAHEGSYFELSGSRIKSVIESLHGDARTILFAPQMSERFGELSKSGAGAYSVDSSVPLSKLARFGGGRRCLQGNLPPETLSEATPEETAELSKKIVEDMLPFGSHIFNLGHGIRPDAKIENVEAMCEAIRSFKTRR